MEISLARSWVGFLALWEQRSHHLTPDAFFPALTSIWTWKIRNSSESDTRHRPLAFIRPLTSSFGTGTSESPDLQDKDPWNGKRCKVVYEGWAPSFHTFAFFAHCPNYRFLSAIFARKKRRKYSHPSKRVCFITTTSKDFVQGKLINNKAILTNFRCSFYQI